MFNLHAILTVLSFISLKSNFIVNLNSKYAFVVVFLNIAYKIRPSEMRFSLKKSIERIQNILITRIESFAPQNKFDFTGSVIKYFN